MASKSSLPVAKTLQDCVVGPSPEERLDGSPSWCPVLSSCCTEPPLKKAKEASPSESCTFQHAVDTFLTSGCCVIPNVLPKAFVKDCLSKAQSDWNLLDETYKRRKETVSNNNHHEYAAVQRMDFAEVVARDGQRIDVRFQLDRFPFVTPGLIYNPIVFPLVQALLQYGTDYSQQPQQQQQPSDQSAIHLLYAGIMWAMPGNKDNNKEEPSTPQKWHADGDHLFSHVHLPPHCINVFYPLIDLNKDNGPTQVQAGTHQLGNFAGHDHPTFDLQVNAGGVCLFDYRLKHRGGANLSKTPRPILYLAYAKSFYRDVGNTRSLKSIFLDDSTIDSPPWVPRLLRGQAMPQMGQGFEHFQNGPNKDSSCNTVANVNSQPDSTQTLENSSNTPNGTIIPSTTSNVGEQWVLFQMTVELGQGVAAQTLRVHHGDIPIEVATQFCIEHGIDPVAIPALTDMIQQQMDAALRTAAQTKESG